MISLRRSFIYWLAPPLLLIFLINAVLSYGSALRAINQAYDRSLVASIKAIAENVYAVDGRIEVDMPYSALEAFEGGVQERVFYAVLGPDRKTITGYDDLPVPTPLTGNDKVFTSDQIYKGDRVRMGVLRKRLYDPSLAGHDTVMIAVAETTESRTELAHNLFFESVGNQLLILALVGLLLAFALSSAFRPVLELRDRMRGRAEDDLTPIDANSVPNEVRPLIDAINHHMARLSRMLGARKRFLADAAHQLRTPLAVLGTQVDYGLRQQDPAEMRRTLEGLRTSIGRTRRLTNQMLSLSRAEADNGIVLQQAAVDLAAIVREVALEMSLLALAKQLDLSYQGPERDLMITGNAAMLREAVANILDNAIRYTPTGGNVAIVLCIEGADACLDVTDSGPGIPPDQRDNAFRRFHRLLGHGDTEGSGLGLAIVKEIVLAHDGRVTLDSGGNDIGLRISVRIPLPVGAPT